MATVITKTIQIKLSKLVKDESADYITVPDDYIATLDQIAAELLPEGAGIISEITEIDE